MSLSTPSSSSSLSSESLPTQSSTSSTCNGVLEEKHTHQQKRRLDSIQDNNKQQKGEKGVFLCEDPTCGARLRTRSGFRRHRQKHASGHVLRKRVKKSQPIEQHRTTEQDSSKGRATPATVVSQRSLIDFPPMFPEIN